MRLFLPSFLTFCLVSGWSSASYAQAQPHPAYPCLAGERWSVLFGSASANPVGAGGFVHILLGQTVIVDEDTVDLGGLYVEGTLAFDDCYGIDYELNSAYIVVTGVLQVGYRAPNGVIFPYRKSATIRLIKPERYTSVPPPPPYNDFGIHWGAPLVTRFGTTGEVYDAANDRGLLVVDTGKFYVYGRGKTVSWAKLSQTAPAGASEAFLQEPVDGRWSVNDQVVFASTDFEYDNHPGHEVKTYVQGEVRTINAFSSSNPGRIGLSANLAHTHFSAVIHGPGVHASDPNWDVAEEGEVGLLTRNVVIEGEYSPLSSSKRSHVRHYGHTMLMKTSSAAGAPIPYCEVEWAEFRNLGVEGALGRYPFHWHKLGDLSQAGFPRTSYLKSSSIHDCFHRFVVVHDTSDVLVESNVGYKTLGTGFYLEEGNPSNPGLVVRVQLKNNLGLAVEPLVNNHDIPTVLVGGESLWKLETLEPSVFWLQHPNNKVEGNHAAGAYGHGFYLRPTSSLSYVHTTASGSYFRNNVAHSNGQSGFFSNGRPKWANTYFAYGNPAGELPAAEYLIAYKNRRYGVWWRTYGTAWLSKLFLADNKSGLYPASEGELKMGYPPPSGSFKAAILTIHDCTIYGETSNAGEYQGGSPAEVAAGRTLPQRYWFYRRPADTGALAHNPPWDTLNAAESYDGFLKFQDMRIGYFQDRNLPNVQGGPTALRPSAGITQAEYRSPFAEDPRNSVVGWVFGSVANRVYYRCTADEPGCDPGDPNDLLAANDNMIRNTVVFDLDDSLGLGANRYVAYDHPFLVANYTAGGNPPVDHYPGWNAYSVPTSGADFVQVWVKPRNGTWTGADGTMEAKVTDYAGIERTMLLYTTPVDPTPEDPAVRAFPFNAILGLNKNSAIGQNGVYRCSFPGMLANQYPTDYEIKVQGAEKANEAIIIGVPCKAKPSSPGQVYLDNQTPEDIPEVLNVDGVPGLTLNDLLHPQAALHAWVYIGTPPAGTLYIKTTTELDTSSSSVMATAENEGTRNSIIVNQ